MAPPTHDLEAALIDGTCQIYSQDPDATSVNKVRRHAEQKLGLDEGFFASDAWKTKSKALIKQYVDKLLDGWEPEVNSKSSAKRPSPAAEAPKPKRRKRALKPPSSPMETQSDESDPGRNPNAKKGAARRNSRPDKQSKPPLHPVSNKRRTSEVSEVSEEDKADEATRHGSDTCDVKVAQVEKKAQPDDQDKPISADDDVADSHHAEPGHPAIEDEEEYSDVIDEPPQPKRKKKDKKEPSSRASKATKPAPRKASTSTPDDGDEAEIKKLQSQLVKCGVRKLWHNELKQYGGDARAKMQHLRRMLTDVGMEGRFSEAKAREIKEMRELMADAEAAQEMNALWGMRSGGRASRSKNKSTKEEESEADGVENEAPNKANDDGGDDDDDDDEAGNTFAARKRRAQADLAFLGDDSDSD